MCALNLDDILVTSLKRIPTSGGDVLRAIKKDENGFHGFGEVYFSWVKQGAIKAWKCHQRMNLNLVVPMGEIRLVFHLDNQKNNFRTEKIGEKRYVRLTVPPGIWFGFQGIAAKRSLLMNFADMIHDPDEVVQKPINFFSYKWCEK